MQSHFIVLEGPDGSGTTYHSNRLTEALRSKGYDVLHTFEPSEGAIGHFICDKLSERCVLPGEALQLLFCADRAQHLASVISPALEQEVTVVCDRYSPSTIVYGAAQGIDRGWLISMNEHFRRPDVTIVLLPPFEVCMERIRSRKENDFFEEESFQRKVYDEYKRYVQEHPDVHVIDSDGEKDEVHLQIMDILNVLK